MYTKASQPSPGPLGPLGVHPTIITLHRPFIRRRTRRPKRPMRNVTP